MSKKYGIVICMFLLIGISLISSCSVNGKTDDFGCFPSSCSLIPQENARKSCEKWKAGEFIWTGECTNAGSSACTKLCEQDTALQAQGKKFSPPKDVLMFLPSKVEIYGHAWYTKEVDLPLTGTIYAFGPALQTGISALKWLQDRGAKTVYSVISIWNEDTWKTTDQLPEELKKAYVKGFKGEPLFIQKMVFLNFLDPDYQNWIKTKVKEKIDAGTNGFTFDEHWGTTWAMVTGEGPCDEFALAGFRKYLENKFSVSELNKKGVTDIQSFNYCQYIVDHHFLSQYQKNYRLVNLGPDYHDYLSRASNAVMKDIINYASTYAQVKGKQIGFGANYEPSIHLDEFDFINLLDTFQFEHFWFPQWRTEGKNASFTAGVPVSPDMKIAVSRRVNAAASFGMHDAVALSAQGVEGGTKLILHQLAESYANRGYYKYHDVVNFLDYNFLANRELLYPYYMFLRNEPQAFLDLQQSNDLAVVLPPHATDNYSYTNNALAISLALSEANIQHDVIDLDKINEYPAVVATGFAWSEAEVDKLSQYIEAGGTVISFDNRFASLNEVFEKVSRPELQNLKKNGINAYGKGKFIFINEDLGYKIWSYQRSEDKAKIILAVASSAIQNIAPANTQVLPYVSGEKLVVHLLNYNFQNKDFIHQENLQIKIHIPDGYSTKDKTMKIISPDLKDEITVDFKIDNGMILFTIPSLYIWDIAIME
jgi:hypothetical protein